MITEPVIIFSDLDGTLLDHYSYQSTPAKSTIAQLNHAKIPVVLTSSKTFAEIKVVQAELDIHAPFIVENGAAIFIPKTTFKSQPTDTTEMGQYWVKSFCSPRQHWLNLIENTPKEYKGLYQGFSTLSVDQLVQLTGLDALNAEQAKDRHYGEPLHWLGDELSKTLFIQYLQSSGATVLKGGRFIHVSGDCDKGKALTWLAKCYEEQYYQSPITTIALGDGENDTAMLMAATQAVQVRSPVHDFPCIPQQKNIIQTTLFGPEGWAEALQQLLSQQLSTLSPATEAPSKQAPSKQALSSNNLTSEVNHG